MTTATHVDRDFRFLLSGQAVSTLGSQACSLAFPLIALTITGSPAMAGLLGFLAGLPALALQMPAGVLVDRRDRRRVMVACDAARLVLVLGVALAGAAGALTFPQLVVTAAAHAGLSVVFNLAQAAVLPMLLEPADLPRGIARFQSCSQGTVLAGRPLGGWLFGIAPTLPFVANALSYVVSLATLCGIRADLSPVAREGAPRGPRAWRHEIGEGLRFVWGQPLLRALALLNACVTLLAGGFTLVVVVLLADLGAPPAQTGLIFGACGAAGLVGAASTPWLLRRLRPGRIYALTLGLSAVAACAMATVAVPWQAAPLAAVIVGLGPPAAVVLQVARARTIPRRLFARVRAVENTSVAAAAPISALLVGLALASLGPWATCALIGAGLLLVAGASLAVPSVRDMADESGVETGAGLHRGAAHAPVAGPHRSARGRHRLPPRSARLARARPSTVGAHRLLVPADRGVTR